VYANYFEIALIEILDQLASGAERLVRGIRAWVAVVHEDCGEFSGLDAC